MTEIAGHLLNSGKVNGVIATKMTYGPQGPQAQTIIVESFVELLECQGSKYMPVATNQILRLLDSYGGVVAFIGTPCQIAGLRMLQERSTVVKMKVRYVIGNFCGGFKDLRELKTIIRRQRMDPARIVRFRYRGGGQPGSMLIEDDVGRIQERPYPDYGGDTGFKKHNRCRLCIDGTAELADFACGDAWLDRFLTSGSPWSLVITRNEMATTIFQEMIAEELVAVSNVTFEEIKQSQLTNLHSKKTRQTARRKLYQLLAKSVPLYDGGYEEECTSLSMELKIHLAHSMYLILERLHLYLALRPVLRLVKRLMR